MIITIVPGRSPSVVGTTSSTGKCTMPAFEIITMENKLQLHAQFVTWLHVKRAQPCCPHIVWVVLHMCRRQCLGVPIHVMCFQLRGLSCKTEICGPVKQTKASTCAIGCVNTWQWRHSKQFQAKPDQPMCIVLCCVLAGLALGTRQLYYMRPCKMGLPYWPIGMSKEAPVTVCVRNWLSSKGHCHGHWGCD